MDEGHFGLELSREKMEILLAQEAAKKAEVPKTRTEKQKQVENVKPRKVTK
jgi:hypothetical protein